MEAAGWHPEWRGGRRPKGGARAAWSATSLQRVGSPGGGGQWGWRRGARHSGFVVALVDRVVEEAVGRPVGGSKTLVAVEIGQPDSVGRKKRAPNT